MPAAIRVENLSKLYRLGSRRKGYNTLRESLAGAVNPLAWARRLRRARPAEGEAANTLWALKDVSFEVRQGEAVSVIGRNGAGKSTLLKAISRIVEPTSGRIEIRGRVGSLLEVGTGFHHELTGRENIFLNGAILGMTRREITAKFDAIVDFSGVEKFLDTAVKYYSSGMYVRLAFAVAAHLEPEVLIVDEVLAVGDAQFQKRCLGKMQEVSSSGRTVLFVSHNMAAVAELTRTCVLLDQGRLAGVGTPPEMIECYLKQQTSLSGERVWPAEAAPGDERLRLLAVRTLGADGAAASGVSIEEPLDVEVEYEVVGNRQQVNVALSAFHGGHAYAFAVNNNRENLELPEGGLEPGRYRTVCTVPGNFLNEGTYRLDVFLVRDQKPVAHEEALTVTVRDTGFLRCGYVGVWPGPLRPMMPWKTERV